MIKKTILATGIGAAMVVSVSAASVTFNIAAEQLKTSGGDPMGQTGVVLLVASTSNVDFGSVLPGDYNVGDFIDGADDVILFRSDLTMNATDGLFFGAANGIALDDVDQTPGFFPGLTAGDPISLYWFPTTNNNAGVGAITLIAGSEGGSYSDPTGLDGSRAWTMPAGGTHDLNFLTVDAPNFGPGSNPNATGLAVVGFVIPEPSSIVSLGLGMLLFFRRRR